ncbi:hypothetical protein JHK85_003629 [Glycine max]|nr:hypothetical protein JHK85_003629 [Glycine max]
MTWNLLSRSRATVITKIRWLITFHEGSGGIGKTTTSVKVIVIVSCCFTYSTNSIYPFPSSFLISSEEGKYSGFLLRFCLPIN